MSSQERIRQPGIREPEGEYELLERKLLHEGDILSLFRHRVRLPNGTEGSFELVRYPGAVSVIPVLEEEPGRREIVCLEQFRPAVEGYIHEIPAGMLEPGEQPLACARRELEEETGYRAERWTHVATVLQSPGISPVRMVYFLAEDLRATGVQNLDPGECLSIKRLPLDGLVDSLVFGKAVTGIPTMIDTKLHVAVFFLGAYYRE